MPTFVHGKKSIVRLATAAQGNATSTDISTNCTDVQLPQAVDTPEVTAFQATGKAYIAGLPASSIQVTGIWDSVLDNNVNGLIGLDNAAVGYKFYYAPAGLNAGNFDATHPGYQAAVLVQNFQRTAAVADKVGFAMTLLAIGALVYLTSGSPS